MEEKCNIRLEHIEGYGGDVWMEPVTSDEILRILVKEGRDSYKLKKLYVREESHALLLPQVGDLVLWNPCPNSPEFNCKEYRILDEYNIADLKRDSEMEVLKIIQRNGIQFFMPKEEK